MFRAVVLGLVQGATEFLPISSKTHLVVVPALLGWPAPRLGFIVLLHLGTLAGLLFYFARRLVSMVLRRDVQIWFLVVATIPAAVVGLLFEEAFERLLSTPRLVAFSLVATALILSVSELQRRVVLRSVHRGPGLADAIRMGLVQVLAFLPGVSRSGITMGAGIAGGLTRATAAEFSFLMSIPAIAGAGVVAVPHEIGGAGIAGFLAAALSGYLAVAFLLRLLKRRTFWGFAIYCLGFGIAAGIALS